MKNWQYNWIATARGFHIYEKPLLRINSDFLVGLFCCFQVLTGLKIQYCCQKVQTVTHTQFSPQLRACNLPCLPERTIDDLRLTVIFKKHRFRELSRSFMFLKAQKLFLNFDSSLFSIFALSITPSIDAKMAAFHLWKRVSLGFAWCMKHQQFFQVG